MALCSVCQWLNRTCKKLMCVWLCFLMSQKNISHLQLANYVVVFVFKHFTTKRDRTTHIEANLPHIKHANGTGSIILSNSVAHNTHLFFTKGALLPDPAANKSKPHFHTTPVDPCLAYFGQEVLPTGPIHCGPSSLRTMF